METDSIDLVLARPNRRESRIKRGSKKKKGLKGKERGSKEEKEKREERRGREGGGGGEREKYREESLGRIACRGEISRLAFTSKLVGRDD